MGVGLALILLLTASLHWKNDYILLQWCLGLSLSSLFIGNFVRKRVSLACGIFLSYSLCSASFCSLEVRAIFKDILPGARQALHGTAATAGLCISLIIIALCLTKRSHLTRVKEALPHFSIIFSLGIVICGLFGYRALTDGNGYTFLIDYAGVGGCFIAACIGHLIPLNTKDYYRIAGIALSIGAIIFCKSAMPYGVLAVTLGAYFFASRKARFIHIAAAPLLLGGLCVGWKMVNSSDRFNAYAMYMRGWAFDKVWWLGYGPGSFIVLGLPFQVAKGFQVNPDGSVYAWPWMHSDVLQLVFENGLIAFILGGVVLVQTLKKLYRNDESEAFSLLSGLVACAFFDYPLRYFLGAFLFAFCVVYAYTPKERAA